MAFEPGSSPLKGKIEEEEFESRDFQELEAEFQAVLKEIGGDKQLEHFRREYEKLHRALKNSHSNEKKLIKKCKELNNQITESTLKVQQALKLSQEENENIRAFQADLDRAVKTLEAFKEKEETAKSTIQNLREQIEDLGKVVEQGSGLAVGQDSTVNELLKAKEELTREVELETENIQIAEKEKAELTNKINRLESTKTTFQEEISTLKTQTDEVKKQINEDAKQKQTIENELNQEKGMFDGIIAEIKEKEEAHQKILEEKSEVVRDIKEVEDKRNEKEFGLQQAKKTMRAAEERKEHQEKIRENILRGISQVEREVQKGEEDIRFLEKEQKQLQKAVTAETQLNQNLITERREAERLRDEAKHHMNLLIRDSEQLFKSTENDSAAIENLKRERDMIMKILFKSKDNIRTQDETVISMNNNKKKLENELKNYTKDIKKLKDKVWELDKEQKRYGVEKSMAYAKYSQCLEEVKHCNSIIAELQKKNTEIEAKIKKQQNLYEHVRNDRNLYSKSLIESQKEIEELQQKRKIKMHEIEQEKDLINSLDTEQIQQTKRLGILNKVNQDLDSANEALKLKEEKLRAVMKECEKEIQRLKYVITEVEQEKAKQKKELELVTNERDILGTQLIRRKEELDLLYEKIKIHDSTLKKGEEQYKQRLGDINILKSQIAELKGEVTNSKKEASMVFDLRKEKYYLEKELLDEKVKVKALSEEVENTMNVHRWRKLEGTEPEAYELITKIHTLQRRLISKTEEVVEKNNELKQLENEYEQLKTTISRNPGPETHDKIDECKNILSEKQKQMKNMEQELGLYQSQANQYKYEIDRLNRELNDMKKNYFALKKKEQITKDQEMKLEARERPPIPRHPPPQRFTGGGFNLAI